MLLIFKSFATLHISTQSNWFDSFKDCLEQLCWQTVKSHSSTLLTCLADLEGGQILSLVLWYWPLFYKTYDSNEMLKHRHPIVVILQAYTPLRAASMIYARQFAECAPFLSRVNVLSCLIRYIDCVSLLDMSTSNRQSVDWVLMGNGAWYTSAPMLTSTHDRCWRSPIA